MSKQKLIPELRFPEFAENWAVISISEICEVYRGGVFSKSDIVNNGSEPCIHYGELFTKYNEVIYKIYSSTNKTECFKSKVGDVLMPSSDVTPDGLARASVVMLDSVNLGGDINILRPKIQLNPVFLSYLINYSKKGIIKLVSGTTVKHIYPSQIITCSIPFTNKKSEQQKIASCLSSLDNLIAAHNQKLELLKDHKKGLMQNLFPQKGEKVPKLRFKEFEKDGEWVEEKLAQIGEPLMCKRVFKEQTSGNPTYGVPF
jgi:type I restriction enzyme S subunit